MMSDEALLDFCRALSSSVKSGLPLSDAFASMSRSSSFGRPVRRAAELVARGTQLHRAFAEGNAFPPVFLALLRAGEEGGRIDEFLDIYGGCLETRIKFRRQIERLLVYPLFVLALAAVLFLLVSFKVVPLVMEPLLKSGAALPPQVFLFSSAAEWLWSSWYKVLAVGIPAILILRWLALGALGRKLGGLAGHLLPVFRFASEEGRLYYLYTTAALLMKAGLQTGAMMDVLAQFSQDDLLTRRRLRRAAARMSAGDGFAASMAPLLPADDRHPVEIAEKAGRLDDTLLGRGKLHYDRHVHRLKLLVTAFNISTLAAIAAICFGLVLTVAWPAVAMMAGAQNVLKSLGLGEGQTSAPAAPGRPARRTAQPKLSLEEMKTRSFNEDYGKKVSNFIRQYGAAAPGEAKEAAPAEEPPPKKKLQGKVKFGSSPTSIEPTSIGGQ
ncbi:MAG: type II secretion system F family protein [Elusimicrobiales bacterium]